MADLANKLRRPTGSKRLAAALVVLHRHFVPRSVPLTPACRWDWDFQSPKRRWRTEAVVNSLEVLSVTPGASIIAATGSGRSR